MKAFKAYDIRGIFNKDFNAEDVYKIGRCLPTLLSASCVLIGRDGRTSSPEIFDSLVRGVTDAGADVDDLGLCTTPMTYYFTGNKGYDCAVMITASHNPKEYNGLKISRKGALPVGSDSGLKILEEMIQKELPPVAEKKGAVRKVDYRSDYIEYFKALLPDISGLKIAVDCSNGMASLFVKDILGDKADYILDEVDGTFPTHSPNPLEPEATELLRNKVVSGKYDIGIIFDGDADRVMFVDNNGAFVRPDLITGVLAEYFLKIEPGKNVLCDIRTSRGVAECIQRHGGKSNLWKVGHAFAKIKMRELEAIFGGELAGHYYFRDFYNCDSALLCACIVLGVVAESVRCHNKTFADLIRDIDVYANTGECNYIVSKKDEAIDCVVSELVKLEGEPTTKLDFDGVRLEWQDWWFNIRKSNTEPYLRLVAEAKTAEMLAQKNKEIEKILFPFIGG